MKRKRIMEYYLHESPGRLRVKIPDLKRNPESAWDLQILLKNLSGIKSSSINTVTGSVITHYDPQVINAGAIMNVLTGEGYVDMSKVLTNKKRDENVMEAVTKAASKALLGFVLDRALQGSPLSIVTAFI
jgi:hypothetical protein